MKTQHQDSQRQPETEPAAEEETTRIISVDNPWRPMDEAPRDRVIEGRFAETEEVGEPIFWRNSRKREGYRWVTGGVWHIANTAGAVAVHPTEWREYHSVELRFQEPDAA